MEFYHQGVLKGRNLITTDVSRWGVYGADY